MLKRILAALLLLVASSAYALTDCSTCSSLAIFPDTTRNFSSSVLLPPVYTDALVLVANTGQTETVPAGANWVIFSGACNYFVKTGASASVPGASTTDGSAPEQNPTAWNVSATTSFTVVSAGACIVTLSFYK